MDQPPPADDSLDISHIAGNASDDIKHIVGNPGEFFKSHHTKEFRFGESIQKRMKVVEVSLNRKAEEQNKSEARVVVELDVTEGQHSNSIQMPNSLVTYCVYVRHVERRRKYSWRVFCIPC